MSPEISCRFPAAFRKLDHLPANHQLNRRSSLVNLLMHFRTLISNFDLDPVSTSIGNASILSTYVQCNCCLVELPIVGILHPNDCDQAIVESVGSNLRAYSLPALLFVWEIYWLVWDLTGSTVLQKTPPSAGVSHFEPEQ